MPPRPDIDEECSKCGCRRETHPIGTCKEFTAHQSSQSKGDDIEALSAEVHKLYCAQYLKDHGAPYWSGGDYSKLDERVKEYDRNIVRWHLKLLSDADIRRDSTDVDCAYDEGKTAGAETERKRILAAINKLENEVGLKPHFAGGALERKKQQQLEIISKMMALLIPNQTL